MDRLSEDVPKDGTALRPLLGQDVPRQMRHALRMRARVTANHMTAVIQFADLLTVQKFRLPNPIGRYKKVAAPSMVLECVCGIVGVESAIIKSQEDRHTMLPAAKATD